MQNFPAPWGSSTGSSGPTWRRRAYLGYALEVEAIRRAREADLLTTPYVFSREVPLAWPRRGADVLVCHMGLTTKGSIGAVTAKTLDQCVELIDDWAEAARRCAPEVLVLYTGPIAEPEDAAYVLQRCRCCHGFYGASSMERLPHGAGHQGGRRRPFVSIRF